MSAALDYDPLRDKSYQHTGLGRSVVDFLAWMELGGAAEATLKQYERDLSRACLMFPSKGFADFDEDDMLHVATTFKPKERRVRVAAYRTFFKWALRKRLIQRNPCDGLPTLKATPKRVVNTFSDAEIAVLTGLPLVDGTLMQLLFDAGLRKSEARHFRVGHFKPDPPPGEVIILGGKGDRDRLIPATLAVSQRLNELVLLEGLGASDHLWYSVRDNAGGRQVHREKPCGEGTFARWWARCLADAGVLYRNPHVARHTFATRWLRRGGALHTLSQAMGHSSIRTTFDLYAHLNTRDLAADFALMDAAVANQSAPET